MSRIDHALHPTDAAVVISSLDFDTNWLLELSNADPAQFMDHAERLYSIMNRMQLVTSRFAKVCNEQIGASA
jgi:hypothetical protein